MKVNFSYIGCAVAVTTLALETFLGNGFVLGFPMAFLASMPSLLAGLFFSEEKIYKAIGSWSFFDYFLLGVASLAFVIMAAAEEQIWHQFIAFVFSYSSILVYIVYRDE